MLRRYLLVFVVMQSLSASAETLRVKVLDQSGNTVPNAVVYALPPSGAAPAATPDRPVIIDQIDKEFVNSVTVIRPGMSVVFPNRDQIRHHVYSFSPAKTFELPLYKDITPEPIRFDQPGVVSLGCNIHDWMSAYIYVVDTPFTAVTDAAGMATLTLPVGQHHLSVWHPRLKSQHGGQSRSVTVEARQNPDQEYAVELKKSFKSTARIAPDGFDGGAYR